LHSKYSFCTACNLFFNPLSESTSLNTSPNELLPAPLLSDYPLDWTLSGEGVFTWTVFKLYRARLFVSGHQYDESQPFILDLCYLRSLPAEMIISASIDELKRLRHITPEVLQNWTQLLEKSSLMSG